MANSLTLVAYIVLLPGDAEPLLATLRALMTSSADPSPRDVTAALNTSSLVQPEDPWLKHSDAAEYLGVSKSTLYQYTCQERIECRKLGGRLEYRRSTLDKFKEEQIRPARRLSRSRSIITSALGSGK